MGVRVSSEKTGARVFAASPALALTLVLFFVGPAGLEPDRALRKCPVGIFSEGDRLPRGLEPRQKTKKAVERLPECGPSWARTSDPLIMSQVLLTS